MVRLADVDAPQLPLHAPMQPRSALSRPLGLFQDRPALPRAQDTDTHPETVGALKRRLEAQGLLGLCPAALKVMPVGRRRRGPAEVGEELQRLKGLYDGFGYRELARILFHPCARRLSHHRVQTLWHHRPPASPQPLPLLDYHRYAERSQARLEGLARDAQGWSMHRIRRFLPVSRPTITAWMARCEADNVARLEDKSRAPKTTGRTAWLPVMVDISPRQQRHPAAGGFRLWRLRGTRDLSVRTVERLMAINRQVSKDIPGTGRKRYRPTEPQLHPCTATAAHADWCMDGRLMACALEGHRCWSLLILDGSSRPMLAGAVAPSEARGVALTVLSTACRRDGVPQHMLADSGGAFLSAAFEGVCTRLGIAHHTSVSPAGQRDMNLMDTPFHLQRRF